MGSLRTKISAAAQELYLREGIEGISMRKIAERVGISAPAIYRHFKNKDELLNEIVIEGLKILEGYLGPALESRDALRAAGADDRPLPRLRARAAEVLRLCLPDPQPVHHASRRRDRAARLGHLPAGIEQVAACIEQGVFAKDDPLETAITIWAEVHGW